MRLRHEATSGHLSCCCGCSRYVGMGRRLGFVVGALQQMEWLLQGLAHKAAGTCMLGSTQRLSKVSP